VEGVRAAGLESVGLWRESVSEVGLQRAARLTHDAGLRVSSLCRGGFLTASLPAERALDDNRRAIDESATLQAERLVMVVGGLPTGFRDPAGPRIGSGMRSASSPPILSTKVRLALEALHPMDCADRAVLSPPGQASDLAEEFPQEQVGVFVDTVGVRWDADVWRLIERAGLHIASFQVCDWTLPLRADVLQARGYMGDGSIDFPPFATLSTRPDTGATSRWRCSTPMFGPPRGRRHRLGRAALPRRGRSRQRSTMSTLRVAPKRSAFRLGRHGCTS